MRCAYARASARLSMLARCTFDNIFLRDSPSCPSRAQSSEPALRTHTHKHRHYLQERKNHVQTRLFSMLFTLVRLGRPWCRFSRARCVCLAIDSNPIRTCAGKSYPACVYHLCMCVCVIISYMYAPTHITSRCPGRSIDFILLDAWCVEYIQTQRSDEDRARAA